MKEKTPVHVKLEYIEAIQGRRDILFAEMNLIRILKSIRKFNGFRMAEFDLKSIFYKEIKDISTDIKKIQSSLPKTQAKEIPKFGEESKEKVKPRVGEKDRNIESQLREIQEKLSSLASS